MSRGAVRSIIATLIVVALGTASFLGATAARAEDGPITPLASPAGEPPPVTEPPADPTPVPTPEPPAEPSTDPTAEPEPVAADRPASRLPLRAGTHGWRVRILQQRLEWLGYEISAANRATGRMGPSTVAAVRQVQAKFGFRRTGVVGPATWALITDRSGTPGRLPSPCRTGRVVCVDKSAKLVRLVVDGSVRLTLDARFGIAGAQTREGRFRVSRKSRDHVSSLYRTWMPFALFFSGGQAIHYSPYFARDGYDGGSHGCVNLRDFDSARWLFDHVPLGTPVYVYRS